MADFKEKVQGFERPTQLPGSREEQDQWNQANKEWWEKHPMRYDFTTSIDKQELSKDFFEEIDKRFFEASKDFAPYANHPFEGIIDYDFIKDKNVLEIGVGTGSHAKLLATHCKEYTGIDITEYATRTTARRMQLYNIQNAKIQQMNAEELDFPAESFDYIWSWGVVHHSANTKDILKEMNRVLKPGGKSTVMVYYRSFWYKYVYAGFFHGILRGYLFKEKNLNKIMQRTIDGAIARFYTMDEWKAMCETAGLKVDSMKVMGMKNTLVILPPGRFKQFIIGLFPGWLARFFTSKCRMGYFLVADLSK